MVNEFNPLFSTLFGDGSSVSNIHPSLTAWAGSTAYAVGQRRSNGGNAYQVIVAGTSASSGGPTTSGLIVVDGTVTWTWLSAIDFTGPQAWLNSLASTPGVPVVGAQWNNGEQTPILATFGIYASFTGHTTSTTNTITWTAAPGESFVDGLGRGPSSPLAYSSTAGVAVNFVNVGGQANLVDVNDSNVVISRIQLKDPNGSDAVSILQVESGTTGFSMHHCIVDGVAQAAGGVILSVLGTAGVYNVLVVDRQPGGAGNNTGSIINASSVKIVNCTLVAVNGPSVPGLVNNGAASSGLIRNLAVFGYTGGVQSVTLGANLVDHCGFSASSIGVANTDNGNNLLSLTTSSQFRNSATDFRILQSGSLDGAGVTDATNVPTLDDIAGQRRPSQPGWSIGASDFLIPVVYRRNLLRLRMHHHPDHVGLVRRDPEDLARRDWRRLADHFRDGSLAGHTWL